MANGTVMPAPRFEGFDDNGDPLSGGLLYTYVAGTTTAQATYSEVTLTTANANPVVLDSAGRAIVYLSPASYKFVLKNSAGTTIWTQDNISAVPPSNVDQDIAGTAGEALTAGDVVWLSDGSGSTTAGRWYKTDADNTYSSTLPQSIGMIPADIASGESGSVRLSGRITGLSGLSAGGTYYVSATAGAITASAPTNVRIVGQADTTTSLVLPTSRVPADASVTQAGIVNLSAQVLGDGAKTLPNGSLLKEGTGATTGALGGAINVNTTAVGNVGAGEDNLMTYAVGANTLSANGRGLRIRASGTLANNATAKTLKFHFGATAITLIPAATVNIANHVWHSDVTVIRTAAAVEYMEGYAIAGLGNGSGGSLSYQVSTAAPAEDTTAEITLKYTGEGGADNDIVQSMMVVEVIN